MVLYPLHSDALRIHTHRFPFRPQERVRSGRDEAALLLGGIYVKTLQRKAREGVIPGRQIGRAWFFRASELDRWIASFIMIGTANSSAA